MNVPCCGHVFSIRILPSRSRICALISPTWLVVTCVDVDVAGQDRVRASRTQVGHSESVVRGQPSAGDVRSELFSRGCGAQAG